jgi:hypothetical protein
LVVEQGFDGVGIIMTTCECGTKIIFLDAALGNYLPYNQHNDRRHFCYVTARYCKKLKGRKDYLCKICEQIIPKGEVHYNRPKWKERYHIECLKEAEGGNNLE